MSAFVVLLALGRGALAQVEHELPLVMSASSLQQQGFVRIINHSAREGSVRIHAVDDSGRRFEPITLSLDANGTVQFNSRDLEQGNPDVGLFGGVGEGAGHWRLTLDTDLDIEPLAFVRTLDGFLTSMHDTVRMNGMSTRYHIPIFNPGSNLSLTSRLRLINPGDRDAHIVIGGLDAQGDSPPLGDVRLVVPAGEARMFTSRQLELGDDALAGRFGDGEGKWELFVSSNAPIQVMNLMQTRSGHLSNLSTTLREAEVSRTLPTSYELQSSVLRTDWRAFLSLEGEAFVEAIAYGDFDSDGDEDVFVAPHDVSASINNEDGRPVEATPVQVYANDGDGEFTLATESFITGRVPEAVHPRKALTGDFNHDGRPDIFVADTGYDSPPPFPGAHPVLLLSSENGLRSVGGLEHVVGFHHGAASGGIDHDGDLDIFVTDFRQPLFLENDGSGNFVPDLSAVPTELTGRGVYTSEIIDVDNDGYVDLLVAGHEFDDQPTAIYWGDRSGTYESSRKTTLPAVAGQGVVVDVDAEDLDNDGDRDIVLSLTGGEPDFYVGYYIQIVANHGSRRFADETTQRITGGARATARWLEWIRLDDANGDNHGDIWIDDVTHWGRTWINDGLGHFRELVPAGFAPIDYAEFDARFVGKRMSAISFVSPGRFSYSEAGESSSGFYRYGNQGPDTGSLRLFYDDVDLDCTVLMTFDSETTGTFTYTCSDGDTGAESWRLEDIPGT